MANGAPFALTTIPMLMQGSSAKSLVILMLELVPYHCHLELAQLINQYGCRIFTAMEVNSQLQIVSTTSRGIMDYLLVAAIPMICQYLALMVSLVVPIATYVCGDFTCCSINYKIIDITLKCVIC